MTDDRLFADVLQELHDARKSGALFVNIVETSEDLYRIYLRDGEIYKICYGSACGNEAMEILQYYTLSRATFFDGLSAPGVMSTSIPIREFIAQLRRNKQKVKITSAKEDTSAS